MAYRPTGLGIDGIPLTVSHEIPYRLHSVSVVVTAEFHNPSILNRDFLVSREIVPDDWEVTEAVTTPPVAIVSYSNGIRWTVEQSNLSVVEDCGPSFQDNYLVYTLVSAYLRKLPHVPYRSLGLNCVVSTERNNPDQWVTRRFLNWRPCREGELKVIQMMPNFTLDATDALCNLSFSVGQITPQQGESRPAVIVNCNVHHAGPYDADGLCAAIAQWPQKQEFVISALDRLLEGQQK